MAAGIYNFTMDQGSTWTISLVYNDSDGNPINLTGYTAKMQLRRKFDSATAALTLATGGQGIVITGGTGTIDITATDEQTGAIDAGLYVYDLDLNNGGIITRLIQGQATVSAEVTTNA